MKPFLKSCKYILCALILFACKVKRVNIKHAETITVNCKSENYTIADSIISPYKIKLEKEMNEILITSESEFIKAGPEGSLGNLVADISLNTAKKYSETNFCLLNNGGLRASLPKGNITVGKIFELMPFDNELVVVKLSGNKVQELLNYIAQTGGQPVAGITLNIKDKLAKNVLINNEVFDVNKSYLVVTTDYLANGGDKMNFFKNPVSIQPLNIKLRDAIIQFLREKKMNNITLKAYFDNRITNE